MQREEWLIQLANALAELAPDQRQAVELKNLQGRSLVDVAARLNRSVPAVAGLLQRGLRALREKLSEEVSGE